MANYSPVEDRVVAGLDEIESTDNVEYSTVEGFKPGQTLRIGSLSAGDFIEWLEAGNDPKKKRYASIRMIVKSLVGPEPENKRYAAEQADMSSMIISKKPHRHVERITKEILKLNGIQIKGITTDETGIEGAKKD